jgi:hypothetical protein
MNGRSIWVTRRMLAAKSRSSSGWSAKCAHTDRPWTAGKDGSPVRTVSVRCPQAACVDGSIM